MKTMRIAVALGLLTASLGLLSACRSEFHSSETTGVGEVSGEVGDGDMSETGDGDGDGETSTGDGDGDGDGDGEVESTGDGDGDGETGMDVPMDGCTGNNHCEGWDVCSSMGECVPITPDTEFTVRVSGNGGIAQSSNDDLNGWVPFEVWYRVELDGEEIYAQPVFTPSSEQNNLLPFETKIQGTTLFVGIYEDDQTYEPFLNAGETFVEKMIPLSNDVIKNGYDEQWAEGQGDNRSLTITFWAK
jgi:hypothetical protein